MGAGGDHMALGPDSPFGKIVADLDLNYTFFPYFHNPSFLLFRIVLQL